MPDRIRSSVNRLRRAAVALLLVTSAAFAQTPWRSSLYPTTWTPPTTALFESAKLIQDFSYAGYRRGDVAVPTITGPVFNVVTGYGADPTGAANSTVAIQSAIDAAAAAGGGVVYLPAGTFKVSPQGTNAWALRITANNIVLRGAGVGQTFVFNDSTSMRNKHIIRVEGSASSWSTVPSGSPTATLTTNLLSPTTTLPVSSVTGFAVNDWIILRADATDAFIAEHNMTDLWAGHGSALGGVMFQRRITAIDTANNRLTIDVPTRYYLKTRDNARVHKAVAHVEEVGLEDFSIGNRQHASITSSTGWAENDYDISGTGAYDVHGSFAVALRRARNCWVLNVASYRPSVNTVNTHILSNGLYLDSCRGVTVRNCDFQRPIYGGGGGNGYMYRLQRANECLVRDCAARYSRHGFVFSHMATSGNVIYGGIAQVTRAQAAPPGTAGSEGCDHHMHLSQSNLIDGVTLDRDYFTAHYRGTSGSPPQHGQTAVHSVYWNLIGVAYYGTKTYIVRSEQARYGYMIGTRGAVTGMSTSSSGGTRTAPVDHAEGAGLGDALQPLSLYHDQVARRLGSGPTLLAETFDTMTAGAAPTGWTVTNDASTTCTVQNTPSSTDRSMRFADSSATGYSRATKTFTATSGLVTASWRHRQDQQSNWNRFFLQSGTTVAVEIYSINAGDDASTYGLYFRDSAGGDYFIAALTTGTWYDVRVEANTVTDTADIYLNGVLRKENAPFRAPVNSINTILFGSGGSSTMTGLFVDDVLVTK